MDHARSNRPTGLFSGALEDVLRLSAGSAAMVGRGTGRQLVCPGCGEGLRGAAGPSCMMCGADLDLG